MRADRCAMLWHMRYASVATATLHAMPGMPGMSLCLKRIELAMLNIFIMTVQFHADRWDGCACMPCPHSISSRRYSSTLEST